MPGVGCRYPPTDPPSPSGSTAPITSAQDLLDEYEDSLPVVLVDGEVVSELKLDTRKIRAALERED